MFVFFVHGHTSNAIRKMNVLHFEMFMYIYVSMCYVCTNVFKLNIKKHLRLVGAIFLSWYINFKFINYIIAYLIN
jgi:hypothetical protein